MIAAHMLYLSIFFGSGKVSVYLLDQNYSVGIRVVSSTPLPKNAKVTAKFVFVNGATRTISSRATGYRVHEIQMVRTLGLDLKTVTVTLLGKIFTLKPQKAKSP